MRRRSVLTIGGALLISGMLGVSGCSGTSTAKPTGSAAVDEAKSRLAAAKKVVDAANGFHLELTSSGVPKQANAVVSASGDGNNKGSFKGSLTAQLAGFSASVPVVAVGGKVYAKLPTSSSMQVIEPKTYGAPDPGKLFSSDGGLSSLLPKTTSPALGDKARNGADVVQKISGKLAGPVVQSTLAIGNEYETYDVTYEVTDKNELRSATLTGQFFPRYADHASFVLTLSKYGETVDITAP